MQYELLDQLPFKSAFRFVDEIISIDEQSAIVGYTLKPDAFFYADHFPGYPVTPGSILIEIMAQGGLVVPGLYLLNNQKENEYKGRRIPLLAGADVQFYKQALPGEKLRVISKKQYFRFGKLKCTVELFNDNQERIASGVFSGMVKEL